MCFLLVQRESFCKIRRTPWLETRSFLDGINACGAGSSVSTPIHSIFCEGNDRLMILCREYTLQSESDFVTPAEWAPYYQEIISWRKRHPSVPSNWSTKFQGKVIQVFHFSDYLIPILTVATGSRVGNNTQTSLIFRDFVLYCQTRLIAYPMYGLVFLTAWSSELNSFQFYIISPSPFYLVVKKSKKPVQNTSKRQWSPYIWRQKHLSFLMSCTSIILLWIATVSSLILKETQRKVLTDLYSCPSTCSEIWYQTLCTTRRRGVVSQ